MGAWCREAGDFGTKSRCDVDSGDAVFVHVGNDAFAPQPNKTELLLSQRKFSSRYIFIHIIIIIIGIKRVEE